MEVLECEQFTTEGGLKQGAAEMVECVRNRHFKEQQRQLSNAHFMLPSYIRTDVPRVLILKGGVLTIKGMLILKTCPYYSGDQGGPSKVIKKKVQLILN